MRRMAHVDIDRGRESVAQFATAHVDAILRHAREKEKQQQPKVVDYMREVQRDVTPRMRAILFDWLVEVAEELELSSETLYLTKHYVDRFLAQVPVSREELQLVGVTAMYIASKFEENLPPDIGELTELTDGFYVCRQVVAMEKRMLDALEFRLMDVSEKLFLRRYQRAALADLPPDRGTMTKFVMLSNYLAELSVPDYGMVTHLPSTIACGAVSVALRILGFPDWSPTLRFYAQTTPREPRLASCIAALQRVHENAALDFLSAIYDKYAQDALLGVSRIPVPAR